MNILYHTPAGQPITADFRDRVARHIGAVIDANADIRCPNCGGTDFGPDVDLASLAVYEDDFLPGAPLLHGVCLDCGHITAPKTDWGVYGDPRED